METRINRKKPLVETTSGFDEEPQLNIRKRFQLLISTSPSSDANEDPGFIRPGPFPLHISSIQIGFLGLAWQSNYRDDTQRCAR